MIGGKVRYYGCSHHNNRGRAVCASDTRERVDRLDVAVLDAIQEQVLTPEAIRHAVASALEAAHENRRADPQAPTRLRAGIAKVQAERNRLVEAIASGAKPDVVIDAIRDREQRLKILNRQLAEIELGLVDDDIDDRALTRAVGAQLERFSELLRQEIPRARQALRKLLGGRPLVFGPVSANCRKTSRFERVTALGALVDRRIYGNGAPTRNRTRNR